MLNRFVVNKIEKECNFLLTTEVCVYLHLTTYI